MVGLFAEVRGRYLNVPSRNSQEHQDAADGPLEVDYEFFIAQLERPDIVLSKELPPVRILGLAQTNERLDRIEIEPGFSFAAGVVGGRLRVELPAIRLLGTIM
jgi:hypothetical protein